MTQEEKQLLLKDLCERLLYGVVVDYNGLARPLFGIEPTQHFQITLDNALDGEHNGLVYVSLDVDGEEPKPYLRPMSSMTEEEGKELEHILCEIDAPCWVDTEYGCVNFAGGNDFIDAEIAEVYTDWLNKKMFDYRGLIEKGLALEAPEGMYIKNKYEI